VGRGSLCPCSAGPPARQKAAGSLSECAGGAGDARRGWSSASPAVSLAMLLGAACVWLLAESRRTRAGPEAMDGDVFLQLTLPQQAFRCFVVILFFQLLPTLHLDVHDHKMLWGICRPCAQRLARDKSQGWQPMALPCHQPCPVHFAGVSPWGNWCMGLASSPGSRRNMEMRSWLSCRRFATHGGLPLGYPCRFCQTSGVPKVSKLLAGSLA